MTQDETNTDGKLTPASTGRQFGVWLIEFFLLGFSLIAFIIALNRMPQNVWEFYLYFVATGILVVGLPGILFKGETLATLLLGCRSYYGTERISILRQLVRSSLLFLNLSVSFYAIVLGAGPDRNWPYDPILRIRLFEK